ncbi:MAG: MBOAT family protein [Akkermansiaceae bacterium]
MIWIVGLMFVGLLLGRVKLPMWVAWILVLVLLWFAHDTLRGVDPIFRMVGICAVLLAGMKGLVYRAWGGHLNWKRYFVFGLGWFGMDPGTFAKNRKGMEWKNDVVVGLVLMVAGTLGAWLVWEMDWRQILVMFLPMSLFFHFGVLRFLKGGLRAAGFPVRTLFPNLLKARGVADFWSRRWNVGYSQMMQRLVGRPVGGVLGHEAGTVAVFVVSGLFHEIAITVPVGAGYGLPSAFFVVHGLLVMLEGKLGKPLGKIPALLLVAVPLGVLFPPEFQTQVIARCLRIFYLI